MNIKRTSRFLAAFLVLVMMITALPLTPLSETFSDTLAIEAEAAAIGGVQLRINSLKKIFKTTQNGKMYFTTTGKMVKGNTAKGCKLANVLNSNPDIKAAGIKMSNPPSGHSCWAFAHFAHNYVFGYWGTFGNDQTKAKNVVAKIDPRGKSTSQLADWFSKNAQPGDILAWAYVGYATRYKDEYGNWHRLDLHHFAMYTGMNSNKSAITYMDSNADGRSENQLILNNSKTFSRMSSSLTKVWVIHASNYNKTNDLYPKFTKLSTSNAANTSVKVTANLNSKFGTDAWAYYLSENKSKVSSVNGTNTSNHKGTGDMDFVRFNSSYICENSRSTTISKYKGQPLKANTTYYYKIVVAVGGKCYQSSVGSFKTANIKPGVTSLRVAKGSSAVGRNQQVTLLWDAATLADSYTITVKNKDGQVVQTKTNVKGTTCVLDGFAANGLYKATITAHNPAGSTNGNNEAEFSVLPDREVTYYDTLGQTVVDTQNVRPGNSPKEPKAPEHEGHTFSQWKEVSTDQDYTEDTADYQRVEKVRYETVYDKNTYTVKFIDTFTNRVLSEQRIKYEESATAPNVTIPEERKGYEFKGWDTAYDSIKKDTEIRTLYEWAKKDYVATITVTGASIPTGKDLGYELSFDITNHDERIRSGRVVAVLKTNAGTILASTESSAFAVDAAGENGNVTPRSMKIFVPYAGIADKAELYVINDFENLGKLSETLVYDLTAANEANEYSAWVEYTNPSEVPTDTDTQTTDVDEVTPEVKVYRYQLRETKQSYDTSMSGYTQDGYDKVKASSGTIDYVSSWHSGFYTGNSLYKKYKVTPKKNGETATTKTEVSNSSVVGYIYWHWCRGQHVGPTNRCIEYNKTSTFNTFHAFYSTTKPSNYNDGAYKYSNSSACDDTYWWGAINVYRQTWTIYNKRYKYYKDYPMTEWLTYEGDTAPVKVGDVIDGKTVINVEVNYQPGQTINRKYYRVKTDDLTATEPTDKDTRTKSISGTVKAEFAGKPVTVWVYKYGQASDYTTEFIETTTVGDEGQISIENAVLREALNEDVGDYKVCAMIDGQERAINLGVIEAPKHKYTVKFYDYDRTTILDTQIVEEGDSATLPQKLETPKNVNVPAGKRFTVWSQSVVNVRSDLDVYPETENEIYTVAFVNWEVQTVSLKKFTYDDDLIPDEAPESKEGYTSKWVVQNGDETTDVVTYGENSEEPTYLKVKGDTVVVTKSEPIEYNVQFIAPTKQLLSMSSEEVEIAVRNESLATVLDSSEKVAYENAVSFESVQETIEQSPDIIFLGWTNAYTDEAVSDTQVKQDMLLYPVFTYPETTLAPSADVESGEYTEAKTVTLSTETPDATIFYTTDGSDPRTSDKAVKYTGPITLTKSVMLTFFASSFGMNNSDLVTETYAINTGSVIPYHIVTIDYSSLTIENSSVPESPVYLVRDGSKLTGLELLELEGNTLDGLYFDETYTDFFDLNDEVIDASMTLYAHYTPNNYTVTFVYIDENGTEIVLDTQQVGFTQSAQAPEPPAINGMVFTGWDNEFTSIRSDTKLTAQYIREDEYASVKLDRTRPFSLNAGDSHVFKATMTPDLGYDIVWTSSDDSIASVDETGRVTGVSSGTATITATIPYTGASASVEVKVGIDYTKTLALATDIKEGFDSERNLRNVREGSNTADEIRNLFVNEDVVIVNAAGTEITGTALVGTGAQVRLMDGDTVVDTVTVIVVGDCSGDGKVNNSDVLNINMFAVDKRTLTTAQLLACDINGDGNVNNVDTVILLKVINGKYEL